MLNRIDITSEQGNLLTLSLEDLDYGYLLNTVDGLDPVKATITSSSFAQLDGSQYQASRREERNIVLNIGLEPNYSANESVRDLRQQLYTYLMPKSLVTLTFYDSDNSQASISGRVESVETPLFSETSEVNVSIICFDPDFYSVDETVISGSTTATTEEVPVVYNGTVETGFFFQLKVNRSLTDFTIYHREPSGFIRQIDYSASLQANDLLNIQTVQGDKFARLNRGGMTYSALYGVSNTSAWLELRPGTNYIRVYSDGAAIPYEIRYFEKYGGL